MDRDWRGGPDARRRAGPGARTAAGAGGAADDSAGRRAGRWRVERRVRGTQSEPARGLSERRDQNDCDARPAARQAAGHAAEAAQGSDLVADPVRRIPAFVDSAGREDDRGDGQEDRRVDVDHVVGRQRHQRREPEAVRRDLPVEHDRHVPGRPERSGDHRGAPQGVPGVPDGGQGRGRHPRHRRLVPRRPRPAWRGRGRAGSGAAGSRCTGRGSSGTAGRRCARRRRARHAAATVLGVGSAEAGTARRAALAVVGRSHRRILQVPLALSDADHGRRSTIRRVR